MEDLGELKTQYYVFKSAGLFYRGNKVLQIYDRGIVFLTPGASRSEKEEECFLYPYEIIIPEKIDSEIYIKTAKQYFTLSTTNRLSLITDLYYFHVQYILKLKRCRMCMTLTTIYNHQQKNILFKGLLLILLQRLL